VGNSTTEKAGKQRFSLGLLGAAAFMVIADVRVIDPLLHIIASEFKVGVGSAAIIVSAYSMMHSTFQTQATELAPEGRGTAVALFAFNQFIGQGIGAAAFGRVVDSLGYVPCFVVAGVAIALLSIWYVYQNQRIRLG
jgi:predicted MFS family arabinose efflux permease